MSQLHAYKLVAINNSPDHLSQDIPVRSRAGEYTIHTLEVLLEILDYTLNDQGAFARVVQRIRAHELFWSLMEKAHLNQLLLSRV